MAAKACKKCDPHEICEECPEWIFTLADLIMCMMGLFVILWVLKPGITAKPGEPGAEELTKVVAAIREAFGHTPDPMSKDPVDMQILMNQLNRLKNNGPGEKGKATRETRGAEGTETDVTSIRPGKQSIIGGRIGFEKGSATLSRAAMTGLDQIAMQIRGHRNIVVVKGHTSKDDFADGGTAEQQMNLSLRRAEAAISYLTTKGVAPEMLRPQGGSTFEPVQQRAYTTELQAQNRRVEVEVTANLIEQFQDRPRAEPVEAPAR